MANQHTPKSRARAIIKRYMETPGSTLENCVFSEIVKEIEEAEWRGYDQGYTDAHDGKTYRQKKPGAVII